MRYDIEIFHPEGSNKYYNLTLHQVFRALELNIEEYGRENVRGKLHIF